MRPLVSILIPACSRARRGFRTLCVLHWRKRGSRREIIVVDDGSTDRTLAIARRFESSQLRVVTQEESGTQQLHGTLPWH